MTRQKYAVIYLTAACAVATLSLAQTGPVLAREAQTREVTIRNVATQPPLTDISARRKHRAPRAAIAVPAPRPVWTGADPTKGPGIETVREMQRSGRCIFDEGYGRWTSCSNM